MITFFFGAMAMTLKRLLLLRRPGRDGGEEERQLENAAGTAAIPLVCLFGSFPPRTWNSEEAEQEEIRMRRRLLVSD
jgi:hypothetical protein